LTVAGTQFLMLAFRKDGQSNTEKSFIEMEVKVIIKDSEVNQLHLIKDYFALGVATCGVGYIPFAPGTWGSLVGVGIYLLAKEMSEWFAVWAEEHHLTLSLLESSRATFTLIFLIVLFLAGVWASNRVEKLTGKKDNQIIVIDEVVGQLVTFLFVPGKLGWWTVGVGFLAFRTADIWKPYPTQKFESLPFGLGAMADDAMAGFYAAAFMSLLCSLYLAL